MKPIKDLSLCFPKQSRIAACTVLTLLALPYWGCGGSSSSSTPSTPTAVATPTPCTQTVLLQQSGQIAPSTLYILPLTVPSAGRLDLTVDWTLASGQIAMYLAQGSCTFEQFIASSCTLLLSVETAAKPKRASVTVQAGNYTMLLGNYGTQGDSGVGQAILSTGSCPAVASAGVAGAAVPQGSSRIFRWSRPFSH